MTPRVSVVVVTYNSASDVALCLSRIEAGSRLPFEVLVVDNASTDGTLEAVSAHVNGRPADLWRVFPNAENVGYSRAANQAARAARGEFIVFLNPDTAVSDGWDEILASAFDPGTGAVGPISNHAAGRQFFERYLEGPYARVTAGELMARGGLPGHPAVSTKLLMGFCLMVTRAVFEAHGGLDETLVLGGDDLEYSLRLRRAGLDLKVVPACFVWHRGQASFGSHPADAVENFRQDGVDGVHRRLVEWYGEGLVPPPMELWGINWFLPTALTAGRRDLTSIVIPVHNGLADTLACLDSIARFTPEPHEILVVDNGSTDGTAEALRERGGVTVLRQKENLGFAGGVNCGIRAAAGSSVLLLNNDTLVTSGWLKALHAGLLSKARVGLTGAVSNYVLNHQRIPVTYDDPAGAFAFGEAWNGEHHHEFETVDGLTGLCLLIRRDVFDVIGLFDERFAIGNYEDNDFCLRARLANFEIVLARGAFIHHHGNRTFRDLGVNYGEISERNRALFLDKWKMEVAGAESAASPETSGAPAEPGSFPDGESEFWQAVEDLGPLVLDDAAPAAERRRAAEELRGLAVAAGREDVAAEFETARRRFDGVLWPDHVPEGRRTLVLGPSPETLAAAFEAGLRVTAVEEDWAAVRGCLDRHPVVPVIHGAFSSLPVPAGHFEMVIFGRGLESFENPEDALREARRVGGEVRLCDGSLADFSGVEGNNNGGPEGDVDPFEVVDETEIDERVMELMRLEAARRGGEVLVVTPGALRNALRHALQYGALLVPSLESWRHPHLMMAEVLRLAAPGATIFVSTPDDDSAPDSDPGPAGRDRYMGRGRHMYRAATFHAELSLYGREVRSLQRPVEDPGATGPARYAEAIPGRLVSWFVNERGFDPARDFPIERSLLGAEDRAHLADLKPGRGAVVFAAAYFDPPMGGGEISARRIAEEIAKHREVHVVSFGLENRSRRLGSLLVHEVIDSGRFQDLIVLLKPDVVLTQLQRAPEAIAAAGEASARTFLFVRSYEALCPAPMELTRCDRDCERCPFYEENRGRMEQHREALRKADRVVVNSEAMRDLLEELTGIEGMVVYPPVGEDQEQDQESPAPLSAQSPESKIPATYRIPPTCRYIALVKPAPHKGLSVFLDLAGRFPEEEFLFIGGRPPGAFPANGVVRDWVDTDRVLDGVRLLLVPSQMPETFGRVVVEALNRGIPVLASRIGGLPEAGGPVARYVDDFENPEAWEQSVREALADQGWAEEVKLHGPAWGARFAAGRVLPALVDEVLKASPIGAAPIATPAILSSRSQIPASADRRIQWHGPFFEHHSFAQVNRELVHALLDLGVPIQPVESGPRQYEPRDSAGRRIRDLVIPPERLGSPDLTVRCGWPPRFQRPESGRLVLVLPWEFGSLPVSWLRAAERSVDQVWAISDYVRHLWLRGGFDPGRVVTVPLGVRTAMFHPGAPAADLATSKSFRFLWVGGATSRKGADILLGAYARAFTKDDDVCLVLKDARVYGGLIAAAVREFRTGRQAPEILHLADDVLPEAMPSLYRACQAFVAPYRGEGYGLPIAEAMSAGVPVLVTGHGGAMQFANDRVAGILPAPLTAWGRDGIDGYGTAGIPYLAEPSVEETAKAMRALFRNREAAAELGLRGAEEIRARHDWKHSARAAADQLSALLGVHGAAGNGAPEIQPGETCRSLNVLD